MSQSKDLFDESSMSFGEHLEVLRVHLIRAIFGLLIGLMIALSFGNHIVAVISQPIHTALAKHDIPSEQIDQEAQTSFWSNLKNWWNDTPVPMQQQKNPNDSPEKLENQSDKEKAGSQTAVSSNPEIAALQKQMQLIQQELTAIKGMANQNRDDLSKPVTLNVQEAFLTYLKVSLVAGFVFASPWIFYQCWLFVAAGLYQHERKYVYMYMPLSLGLFLGGATFCFFFVLPFVLDFLLGFNAWLNVNPTIRLSEWISFAIMLPVMFGLSFQLPLVMLLLERISIFEVSVYREKRRMAILVIAIISMFMTPADPMSMMMMMLPLVLLYELGIWMCTMSKPKSSPFEAGHAT